MRNSIGQYVTPDDKSIDSKSEVLLGLYLDSLTQQKPDTKSTTKNTRGREVRYFLSYCEVNNIDPLAAKTPDVRGYIQVNTDLADTTLASYYTSVQSFYSIIENDQVNPRLTLEHGHPCSDSDSIDLRASYNVHPETSEYKLQNERGSAESIEGVRDDSGSVLSVSPESVRQLFDAVPGKTKQTRLRNEIAIRLNWYTGCRSVELARLKIQNINWSDCTIRVRSAKLSAKTHPDLYRRVVVFPREFATQLRRWCERVRHSFSPDSEKGEGAILVTQRQTSMNPAHINDIVKEAAHNAGVQQSLRPVDPDSREDVKEWLITTHRLRRSAITHWVNDCPEISIDQARRLAGHASVEQTIEYVFRDDEKLAADYHRSRQ